VPGKGTGKYPYENRRISIEEAMQLRNEQRLRNEVKPPPNLAPVPA